MGRHFDIGTQATNWQEIATELSKETDSARLSDLACELDKAFRDRDQNPLATRSFRTGPMPQKLVKRLLFVDDEPSIRATLPLVLQQHGFDVTSAASVPEAIQKIGNQAFEAVLSDLNIAEPGDGFAVVRAIRQVNPQCVAVILTGYPGFDTAVEGIRENIDDYIVKPVDIEVLVASMDQNLAKRASPERLRTGTE